MYENDTEKLKVSEQIILLYKDQADLLLNFLHISLDVGKKHIIIYYIIISARRNVDTDNRAFE